MSSIQESYIYFPETSIIPYITIPTKLKELALECPEREAFVFWTTDGERNAITYSDLYTKAEQFGRGLVTFGLERNSTVAIANKNCPEWLISTFGTQMAGLTPLHFSFASFTSDAIVSLVNGVGNCSAMIIEPCNIDVCEKFLNCYNSVEKQPISEKISSLRNVFLMNYYEHKYTTVEQICKIGQSAECYLPCVSPDDICGIFLTSGSTGMAKAVPHTHIKMLKMGYYWGVNLLQLKPGEKFYNDKPFSWQGSYPTMSLCSKSTRVTACDIMTLKSVDQINTFTLRVLEKERCVSAFLLTPCICDLISRPFSGMTVFPLRSIITAGLPVDAQCAKSVGKVTKTFGVAYGCTEIGFIALTVVDSPEKYENYAVGYPVHGVEVKIVDDKEMIVPPGTAGEIYVRARERFLGYLNAKEKSAQCCERTGWYKSDDVGFIKSDGSLVVTGRKSDVMIIGGVLVSPAYIEGILKKHESVINAYVYPVKDRDTFQQSYAAILLKKGSSVSEQELKEFVTIQKGQYAESFLANLYVPRRFLFFESFPAAHSGKLDRKALAEKIKERLQNSN